MNTRWWVMFETLWTTAGSWAQDDQHRMRNCSIVNARVRLDDLDGGEVDTCVSFCLPDRPDGPLHGCSSSVFPHPTVEDGILGEAGDVSGGVAPSSCVVGQRRQLQDVEAIGRRVLHVEVPGRNQDPIRSRSSAGK
jgi:hypothetical protein